MAIDGTTPGNALQRLRDLLSALPKADRGIHYESAHRRAGRGYETEMLTVYGEMARALFWITNNTQTIETALAAAEQPVVDAWQPIETAPRDKTVILAAHSQAALTVWWDNDVHGWVDGETNSYDELLTFPVTHWRQLPPLPCSALASPAQPAPSQDSGDTGSFNTNGKENDG